MGTDAEGRGVSCILLLCSQQSRAFLAGQPDAALLIIKVRGNPKRAAKAKIVALCLFPYVVSWTLSFSNNRRHQGREGEKEVFVRSKDGEGQSEEREGTHVSLLGPGNNKTNPHNYL